MCNHGETEMVRVLTDPKLSHTGEACWKDAHIDKCIAPMVRALNEAGIYTSGCCCGHGQEAGSILLHSGETLYIQNPWDILPECRFSWTSLNVKDDESPFYFVITNKRNMRPEFKYTFDCPESLEKFINVMSKYLHEWKAKNDGRAR